jgi:hypothetical protein
MTPEEHYARGLELLDLAERSIDVGVVHANGVLAQGHFGAASSGAAIRVFAMLRDQLEPQPPAEPACGQEPCEHAPGGVNHPEVPVSDVAAKDHNA